MTDGSVVWTEATEYLIGFNTTYPPVEVSGGGYAREAIASTGWSAQSNSSDLLGVQISNSAVLTFPSPSPNWGLVCAGGTFDASTAGNQLYGISPLTNYLTIISGNPAPTVPAGDLVIEDI